MRTTLTLEPDVAMKLKKRMAERKVSLKKAVNDALRTGLAKSRPEPRVPYKVEPHDNGGFIAGIDQTKFNQLVDEMEVEEFMKKYQRQNANS